MCITIKQVLKKNEKIYFYICYILHLSVYLDFLCCKYVT